MSGIKIELEQNELKRIAFHAALSRLRKLNNDLSEEQRKARLTKDAEKKKPLGERDRQIMAGKDAGTALQITIVLRAMRRLKGLPMDTVQRKICPHCKTVLSERKVEIHALPKAEYLQRAIKRIETGVQTLVNFQA